MLLTMTLRDPFVPAEMKRGLLGVNSRDELRNRLERMLDERGDKFLRSSDPRRTYSLVFAERLKDTLFDEEFEKKERNSTITLTFFSSQGNIIQSPGATQLGDANDLTSFTTVLSPNNITPISSFFTKSGNGLEGRSILTDVEKVNGSTAKRARPTCSSGPASQHAPAKKPTGSKAAISATTSCLCKRSRRPMSMCRSFPARNILVKGWPNCGSD
ncbi:MAG: hypothetical protein IPK83_17420 [Planctomycetes bacterium]|nr:hypothetical protein [Planctomycetota bacterium]